MIIDDKPTVFRFRTSLAIQKALEELGIYFCLEPGTYRLREGGVITAVKGAVLEPYVGYSSNTIFAAGFASYTNSLLPHDIRVGRYCSAASNVRVMGQNHPLHYFTTNSIIYGKWSNIHLNPIKRIGGNEFQPLPFQGKPLPVLEHDVWIGQDVLLARGITLGTGCVVGTGSVVTKSVPPYAIAGGNPARVLRYRFSEVLAEKLLCSQWWRFAFPHFADLPISDANTFIDQLDAMQVSGQIEEFKTEKVDLYKVI